MENLGLNCPYLTPHCPIPAYFFYKEIDIHCSAWDAKHKPYDNFYNSSHWVFELPELQNLLLPQWMMGMEERHFWLGQDINSGKALVQGTLSLTSL